MVTVVLVPFYLESDVCDNDRVSAVWHAHNGLSIPTACVNKCVISYSCSFRIMNILLYAIMFV